MSGLSASGLKTQIKSYTEVDDGVLTDAVLENIILNAQQRIFMDLPISHTSDLLQSAIGEISTPPSPYFV